MAIEHWLILNNALVYSPLVSKQLLARFGHPQAICAAETAELLNFGVKPAIITAIKQPNENSISQQLHWIKQAGHRLLTLEDEAYPPLLRNIYDPPLILFAAGQVNLLSRPQIAMVGSRTPSAAGTEIAWNFAAGLAQAGLTVTSGLAAGIDGASHRGALNSGTTIAVLGSGLQQIYPRQNHSLAEDIMQRGLLIAEFPPQTRAAAHHFPQRNRLISGLSLGTLVVEATLRSGSLITAKLAAEQGREVFAIPSSIHNPLAQGCHVLIQQGAKLVTGVADILTEIAIPSNPESAQSCIMNQSPPATKLAPDQAQLLKCVGFDTTAIDQIVRRSSCPVAEVTAILVVLELHGYIRAVPGGYLRMK